MVEFDFNRFTIRWELEDKNFLKIDIICLLFKVSDYGD